LFQSHEGKQNARIHNSGDVDGPICEDKIGKSVAKGSGFARSISQQIALVQYSLGECCNEYTTTAPEVESVTRNEGCIKLELFQKIDARDVEGNWYLLVNIVSKNILICNAGIKLASCLLSCETSTSWVFGCIFGNSKTNY